MSELKQEKYDQVYMAYKAAKKVIESTQKIIDGFDQIDMQYAERYQREQENELSS